MAENDSTPGFRTALEIRNRDVTADVRAGAESIQMCEDCEAWTGHEMNDDGTYSCLSCALSRSGPTCAHCDEVAAAVVDGRALCGTHALAFEGSK